MNVVAKNNTHLLAHRSIGQRSTQCGWVLCSGYKKSRFQPDWILFYRLGGGLKSLFFCWLSARDCCQLEATLRACPVPSFTLEPENSHLRSLPHYPLHLQAINSVLNSSHSSNLFDFLFCYQQEKKNPWLLKDACDLVRTSQIICLSWDQLISRINSICKIPFVI